MMTRTAMLRKNVIIRSIAILAGTASLKKIFPAVIVLLVFVCSARGQDQLFTQFYHSPLYLNPAFTGCSKSDFRASFTSRLQWINLPSPLRSHTLAVDKYFSYPKASVGLIATRIDEGYLNNTQLSVIGAKSLGSDEDNCHDWFLNFAIQAGVSWRNANRKRLLFSDQLNEDGPTGQPSQFEEFKYGNRPYFDISSGAIFVYRNVMLGVAGYHLSKPFNGLFGNEPGSRLPRRFTIHLSYITDKYPAIDSRILLKPTVIFNIQDVSRSVMGGMLLDFPNEGFELSAWYKNNMGLVQNHSIGIGFNLKLGRDRNAYTGDASTRFNIGLTGDAELNRPGVGYTKGSYELGMMYERNLSADNVCPKPYGECAVRFPWVFH
jgi:type IX secretion system PorP/SprF family membrane protein